MNYPKYYITYAVMSMEAGANPFGHSCLIFSKQEEKQSPIQVIDSFGFYSQPSTTNNPLLKGVKQAIGLGVDLQGGHGVLMQETMRNINVNGLRGMSFPATKKQFNALIKSYQDRIKMEQEVIEELNNELISQGKEANGYTRFIAEKEKAAMEGRRPRLKPFHITMHLNLHGLDSSDSYTCKDDSLECLMEHSIITTEIRKQLVSGKAEQAFPIFSERFLTPIRLIGTGEPELTVSKRTGAVHYNHVWGKNSLFWATPIHMVDKKLTLNERNELDKNYHQIKEIHDRIRKVEHLLREKINEIDKKNGHQEQHRILTIQLKRVENLAFLFINADENQHPNSLAQKLLQADLTLGVATLAINPERLNYSFILRVYESSVGAEAILGLIAIVLSAVATVFIPPAGGAMLVASSLFTARQLHGFYKEEDKFNTICKNYRLLENAEPELTPVSVA